MIKTISAAALFTGFCICQAAYGETGRGTIRGTVTDAKSGKPVPAATIFVTGDRIFASSDMSGKFSIEPSRGRKLLIVQASPYELWSRRIKVEADTLMELDIALETAASPQAGDTGTRELFVWGRCVRADNRAAIPHAQIRITCAGIAEQTDEEGRFAFLMTHQRGCTLTVRHPLFRDATLAVEPVGGDGAALRIDVALEALKPADNSFVIVTGKVIAQNDSSPVSGAKLSFSHDNRDTVSDDRGLFCIRVQRERYFLLYASKTGVGMSDPVAIEPGDDDTVRVIIALQRYHGGAQAGHTTLAGTVSDEENSPLAGFCLRIRPSDTVVTTDSAGFFRIAGLGENIYDIRPADAGWLCTGGDEIFIREGGETVVSLIVRPLDRDTAPSAGNTVTGMVVDASRAAPLAGVVVAIENRPSPQATTDSAGRFTLTGIAPGRIRLTARMAGYLQYTSDSLDVAGSARQSIDILLKPDDAVEMGRTVVRTTAVTNTNAALLKKRQELLSISDGIAADEMSRAGAGNAADALKFVTGVTILEDKFVIVRGLSERYCNVTLDGVSLPSSEPDRRAVALDMFPTGMLDNIEVHKTWSPELAPNFAGGSVDLATKSFPEKLTSSARVSAGVLQSTTGRMVITDRPGTLDWLGFDDGYRGIPPQLSGRSVSIPDLTSRYYLYDSITTTGDTVVELRQYDDDEWSVMHEKAGDIAKSFNTSFAPCSTRALPDVGAGYNIGNTLSIGGRPLGFFAGINYSSKTSAYTNGEKIKRAMKGHDSLATALDSVSSFRDSRGSRKTAWSAMLNAGFKPAEHQQLRAVYLYSRNAENWARSMYSIYHEQLTGMDERFLKYENKFLQRGMHFSLLKGEHGLGGDNITVQWNASWSKASQDEPDYRTFTMVQTIRAADSSLPADTTYQIRTNIGTYPEHQFRWITENNYEGGISLKAMLPELMMSGKKSTASCGGVFARRTRDYRETAFEVVPAIHNARSLDSLRGDAALFCADDNMGIVGVDSATGRYLMGNMVRLKPSADTAINHFAYQNDAAAFCMAEVPLCAFFSLAGGVRYHNTAMRIQSWRRGDSLYEGAFDRRGFFWSLQAIVFPRADMKVCAGYSTTNVLPVFREKAAYPSFDMALLYTLMGNPRLGPTSIRNYDLRAEWYPGPGELVAAGVFYKNMRDIIIKSYNDIANDEITWVNVNGEGTGSWFTDALKGVNGVSGVEVEARKRLDFIPALKGLAAGGNLTLVRSRRSVDSVKARELIEDRVNPQLTVPMNGASPFVINVSASWEREAWGSGINAYFNIFGKRLDFETRDASPDVYEYPRPWLAISVTQKILPALTMKAEGTNLLNPAYMTGHEFKGKNYVRDRYYKGAAYSLGLTYRFH